MQGIRDLIENVTIPKFLDETVISEKQNNDFDYQNCVSYDGVFIPAFGSTAIFKSKLATQDFTKFLIWLFEQYDTKMNCNMK